MTTPAFEKMIKTHKREAFKSLVEEQNFYHKSRSEGRIGSAEAEELDPLACP